MPGLIFPLRDTGQQKRERYKLSFLQAFIALAVMAGDSVVR